MIVRVLHCLVLVSLLTVAVVPAMAQDPGLKPTTEVYGQAAALLAGNRFAEAIPWLNELLKRTGNRDDVPSSTMAEWSRFHLALAYIGTDQIDEGVKALDEYLANYKNGMHRSGAHLLLAEVHATKGEWEKVIEGVQAAMKEERFSKEQRPAAARLLGDAYFKMEKWEKAMDPLMFVFRNLQDRVLRNDAAAKYTTCLARLEKFKELYEFLPAIYQSSARFDAGLNVALIEGGDANLEKGNQQNALLLYRLVFSKKELLEQANALLAFLRAQLDHLPKTGLSGDQILAAKRRLERAIKDGEEELKRIEEFPDYDQELRIRLATAYLQLKRYWEALLLYRSIYDDFPEHKLAEQALYSAFATALEMGEEERALVEGYDCLRAFPNGEFWDPLTVTLAELHLKREEFEKTISVGKLALEKHPEHTMADHVYYLMAYAHFQLEQFDDALAAFAIVIEKFPQSGFREPAAYWHGMTQLYKSEYALARDELRKYIADFPNSAFVEDASYRVAVSQYGLSDYEGAYKSLTEFTKTYPDSQLKSEALSMTADILSSWRKLDEAIELYKQAVPCAVNQQQANYATFQHARVLELDRKFDDIIALFRAYIEKYGDKANFTEATYWIGTAQMQMEHFGDALNTFFDAIVQWGNKPENLGVDMIIRDVVHEQDQLGRHDEFRQFMDRLYKEMEKAREAKQLTLEFRLVALFAETQKDPKLRSDLAGSLLRDRYIPIAAPITLDLMGREAVRLGQNDFAQKIYRYLLDHYDKSDLVLDALKTTADLEFSQAHYPEAEKLFHEIVNRFPTSDEAGWAEKRLADSFRMRRDYDKAIASYTSVLGVREWRGELWPESLYWLGVCNIEQGKFREAHAFFERIFVLYEGYPQWVAKAYLKSAECKEKLGQKADAAKTYREMLAKPTLAQFPELVAARKELSRLEGAP